MKSKQVNKIFKSFVYVITMLLAITVVYMSWIIEKDIDINIMDTNTSISRGIDAFIKENNNKAGVHSYQEDEYNYVLIVSDKEKALDMSINLYRIYKSKFKINIEYEVEVDKETISESNPDKIQTMLIRFKEKGKINPIVVNKQK